MAWAADGAVQSLPGGPAVRQMDLAPPATQIAADVQSLHYGLLVVCLLIFVGVFGVMFYSILKHRKSLGAKPANFHESVKVEIAWTIVPFIIVACMGFVATKTVVAQKDTSNADLTIKATGYQWKWGYDYIKGEGEGIGFLATLDVAQLHATRGDTIDARLHLIDERANAQLHHRAGHERLCSRLCCRGGGLRLIGTTGARPRAFKAPES